MTGRSARLHIEDELIARCRRDEPAARDELARRCLPFVWRTVYLATGGGPAVEDLVQDAMLELFRDLPGYEGRGELTSWLWRVAVNVVRRHQRRTGLWRRFVGDVDTGATSRPDQESGLAARQLLARLARHVARLPPAQREVVALSLVEELAPAELGAATGLSLAAAKKNLTRGRARLAEQLRRDEAFRSARLAPPWRQAGQE